MSGKEFSALYTELRKDIDEIHPPIDTSNNIFYKYSDPAQLTNSQRRSYIRAIFAYVEGTGFFLRQQILTGWISELKPEMIMALRELQVEVNGAGLVSTKRLRVASMSLFKMTINTYGRLLNESVVKCFGDGFEYLKQSVLVRDRLMHPKSAQCLIVTDEEIRKAICGFSWLDLQFGLIIRIQISLYEKSR